MSGPRSHFGIVGAGLAGSMMACYLGREGHEVDVYERRPDPQEVPARGGRSINLALSHRGIRALNELGLSERALETAVPMRGRLMHGEDGRRTFQPYGTSPEHVIHSVSREGLNGILLDTASAIEGVRLHFDATCHDVDVETAAVVLNASGDNVTRSHDALIGADGAYSRVRSRLQRRSGFDYSQSYLTHGYKELTMPAAPGGGWVMESDALHIWPRRDSMMIALPNADGTFTCTLFWPFAGPHGFGSVPDGEGALAFFEQHYADALPFFPALAEEYESNPVGSLVTVRCGPWHLDGRVVLIGDAAHAVVPFFGQGMNASFEDCRLLNQHLCGQGGNAGEAFAAFYAGRKADADAIADLAIYNYEVMRNLVASRRFLVGRALGRVVSRVLPGVFLPLYTMVSFTSIPYAQAAARYQAQGRWLRIAGTIIGLTIISLILWALLGGD